MRPDGRARARAQTPLCATSISSLTEGWASPCRCRLFCELTKRLAQATGAPQYSARWRCGGGARVTVPVPLHGAADIEVCTKRCGSVRMTCQTAYTVKSVMKEANKRSSSRRTNTRVEAWRRVRRRRAPAQQLARSSAISSWVSPCDDDTAGAAGRANRDRDDKATRGTATQSAAVNEPGGALGSQARLVRCRLALHAAPSQASSSLGVGERACAFSLATCRSQSAHPVLEEGGHHGRDHAQGQRRPWLARRPDTRLGLSLEPGLDFKVQRLHLPASQPARAVPPRRQHLLLG